MGLVDNIENSSTAFYDAFLHHQTIKKKIWSPRGRHGQGSKTDPQIGQLWA